KIRNNLVEINEDGSFILNQEYFNYATGLTMVKERKWESLFGFSKRKVNAEINQEYKDLAFAIQQVTEEIVINLCKEVKKITDAPYLCVAGGVGLNGVAMGKVDKLQIFEDVFVQPAAGDAGGALGAAYAANHIYYDQPRNITGSDGLKACYLGPQYTNDDILKTARRNNAHYEIIEEENILLSRVAKLIAEGKVIGWFQGRMEFGPRALGSRSILADARDPGMQKKLNLAIKFREGFRPFAPIVAIENVTEYFEQEKPSPYMMFVKPVVDSRKCELPSVTHVDGTARLQTIHKETNPLLWKLLNEFQLQTGCHVIINTSFNVKDEPIVNTPEEAYNCFMRTDMDHLVAGNFIFSKNPIR
ncbi:MAG: carbamoyltransferase, partial [Chitinophagaceae bacterium]|nr:carbamoyltransferase [Chitinophagaceae bacterium]